MWVGCSFERKWISRCEPGYCWEAGEALDLLFVPGGEGRMMRNAAIAAMIMTRITINTRDRERLGQSSELRFSGSIYRWMRDPGRCIEEILSGWPGDDERAFQERTERRGRALSLAGSVRYLMGCKRGTCGVVSRS